MLLSYSEYLISSVFEQQLMNAVRLALASSAWWPSLGAPQHLHLVLPLLLALTDGTLCFW